MHRSSRAGAGAIVAALSETRGIDTTRDGCTVWRQLALQQQLETSVEHEMAIAN